MSNLGKMVDGSLHICGENERKVITISNPTDNILKTVCGYKDVIYGEKPDYDIGTQCLKEVFEETDSAIYVNYEVEEAALIADEPLFEEEALANAESEV